MAIRNEELISFLQRRACNQQERLTDVHLIFNGFAHYAAQGYFAKQFPRGVFICITEYNLTQPYTVAEAENRINNYLSQYGEYDIHLTEPHRFGFSSS